MTATIHNAGSLGDLKNLERKKPPGIHRLITLPGSKADDNVAKTYAPSGKPENCNAFRREKNNSEYGVLNTQTACVNTRENIRDRRYSDYERAQSGPRLPWLLR